MRQFQSRLFDFIDAILSQRWPRVAAAVDADCRDSCCTVGAVKLGAYNTRRTTRHAERLSFLPRCLQVAAPDLPNVRARVGITRRRCDSTRDTLRWLQVDTCTHIASVCIQPNVPLKDASQFGLITVLLSEDQCRNIRSFARSCAWFLLFQETLVSWRS